MTLPQSIKITVEREPLGDSFVFTLLEDKDASGYPAKRGGELSRGQLFGTDDATFLPAFGKYVRDLSRKHPDAMILFEVVFANKNRQ